MEHRLEEKEKEIKLLRSQVRTSSTQDEESNQQQFELLEEELAEKEHEIEKLVNELNKKEGIMEEMKREL
jgi:predicted translin family RNA/ssDNA-binding protein